MAAAGLAAILVGLGLASTARLSRLPPSPAMLAAASAAPVASSNSTAAVRISQGEGGAGLVASWAPPVAPGFSLISEGIRIDVAPGGPVSGSVSGPVGSWVIAVRPGATAVALPSLPASRTYTVTVTVVGPRGSEQLGPSAVFAPSVGSGAPGGALSVHAEASALPCEGATYGVGVVTVDGWAGYQGSYCIPPAFVGGTGAFCIDHGLDYPFGGTAYGWQESLGGGPVALLNQYDQAADPALVARLNWIMATWGSTSDPARATAIGIISHAVMGDYPGLTIGDLAPAKFRVAGGDPASIAADTSQMWTASALASGTYHVTLSVAPGPYTVGQSSTGTVTLTGQGGGPIAGIPIDFSQSAGVSVIGDQPVRTGSNGVVGFHFTPFSTSFHINATTPVSLPGAQVEVWTPTGAWVATQRVVTPGPAIAATGSVALMANALGQATLVKVSSDAGMVPVGLGFRFAIEREGATGRWTPVAQRSTALNGTMQPITGLVSGTYQVVEQATPVAFLPGGPWRFALTAGERATWTLEDRVRLGLLQIVKTGDNPIAQPIGAGVRFAVTADPLESLTAPKSPVPKTRFTAPARAAAAATGVAPVAVAPVAVVPVAVVPVAVVPVAVAPVAVAPVAVAPAATLVTGAGGRSAAVSLPPGRYLVTEVTPPAGYEGAAPIVVLVPPAKTISPVAITIHFEDHAVRGSILLRKTDAHTGAPVAGAELRITASESSADIHVIGTWTSAIAPVKVASLLAGVYTVAEVRAPPGYALSANPTERVVLRPGETLEVTFADGAIPVPTTTTARPTTTVPRTTRPTTTVPRTTRPTTTRPATTVVASTTATVQSSTTSVVAAPLPAASATSGSGALAFTGSPSLRLVGWALVALGAGIGLVGLARARRYPRAMGG